MTDTTPKPDWRSYATQIRASILHREKAAQAGATDAMVGPEPQPDDPRDAGPDEAPLPQPAPCRREELLILGLAAGL